MQIVHSVEELTGPKLGPFPTPAVVIGNLDGVHRGHQALIASARSAAASRGGTPCVLTFSPHPQEVLRKSSHGHRLTTDAEKFALLEKAGIGLVLALPFDAALSALSPETFFETYLVKGLQAASVHVGDDFHFGRGRSGDTSVLQACGLKAAMQVEIVPAVLSNGVRISSSEIRRFLHAGKVAEAAGFLGRPYRLSGVVGHGQGRGRQLGVPTANVQFPLEKVAPLHGVYATRAHFKEQSLPAISNFGVRPTFEGGSPREAFETHILDYSQDLYDQPLAVDFVQWVRAEKRFESIEQLRAQIAADIETTRRMG
jgi:riboflavin kinase / FMN adenylyltransferase